MNQTGTRIAYSEAMSYGIELCRKGNWDEGLFCLNHILQTSEKNTNFPGSFYSFLGYGIARKENRIREGIKLCQKAVDQEFYEPIHFLNLARCQLLAGNRRAVARTLTAGLELDPNHKGLLKLQKIFGLRKAPVIPFLNRNNPMNIYLGKLRHRLQSTKK